MALPDIVIAKLNGEKLNPEEEALFESWYVQPEHQQEYLALQKLQAAIYAKGEEEKRNPEQAWIKLKMHLQPRRSLSRWYGYAAVLLLLLGFSTLLYHYLPQDTALLVESTLPILPGNRQAVLTLSNGQEIPLGTARKQVKEKGAIIRHDTNNRLAYQAEDTSMPATYNSIRIPRGGEYQVRLSDGTVVWLNAETTLTYPVVFAGNIRTLTLDGEAYFEVAPDTSRPFIVHTSKFDVRVTGTEFNVSTYPEEYETATLVKGGIILECNRRSHLLKPGEQFRLKGDIQEVVPVEPAVATAWRNGIFYFKERRLESLLNELARWYNFDVIYLNPEVKDYHFTAWFKRSSTIQEVMEILEKTNKIKLNLQEKTLTVTP